MTNLCFGKLYKARNSMTTYPQYIYTIEKASNNVCDDIGYDQIKILCVNEYNNRINKMFRYEITEYYEMVEDG